MTNYEYYKDEILENGECFTQCDVYKKLMRNKSCEKMRCNIACFKKIVEWFNQEHKEPIKLTRTEYHILKGLNERFKYITRNGLGFIQIHTIEPYKVEIYGWDNHDESCGLPYTHLFQFIKWEDEEPYSIEELLKCEVVDDA